MKHKGANLELHVNEDKTYIGDNVEKHDSPETDIKVDEMTVTSGGKQYAETEILDKVNLLTASGHYSLDNNIADSITWKRT